MEVDISNHRHARRAHNLFQRRGRFNIGAGNADDIDPCILATADLVNRSLGVRGERVGHGLHRNRGIAADGHITDHDLTGLATRDIAPRAYRRHGQRYRRGSALRQRRLRIR